MKVHRFVVSALSLCIIFPSFGLAAGPNFPVKPLRWIVPYSAGGPTELIARIVGQKTTDIWGQQVVVDPRPGANSIIGTDIAAHAAPDGYTMLLALPAFTINPSVYRKLPYDPIRDFVPVTLIASASYLLLVNPRLQVSSVKELISMAKARATTLTFGSGGVASPAHLAMELLIQRTGIKMVHVPYKGGAPALVDLMSGQIQVLINPALSALPYVKSGKLRVIAITGAKRSSLFPNVPTVAESGLPGYNVGTWYGLFAPRGTPKALVDMTYRTVHQALQVEAVQERLSRFDANPVGNTPSEFSQFVHDEIARWRQIVKVANIDVNGG